MNNTPRARSQFSWVVALTLITTVACTTTPDATSVGKSSPLNCGVDGDYVGIPTGEFVRGSDRAERDYAYEISGAAAAKTPEEIPTKITALRERQWFAGEPASAIVELPGFCIARNVITNADYRAFIQATGHPTPGITAAEYQEQGFLVHPYAEVEPYVWQGQDYPEGEGAHPVVLVSYEDAIAYAAWKGEQDGHRYRLPTVVEWEKAARGTDGQYFPWGNEWQDDATNWAQEGEYRTSAIAIYPLSRSEYGVEDMAGNVFEWTSTETKKRGQPAAILKGCSWDDLPGFCRAAYQHSRPVASRHILFGFRLVRDPDS